MASSSAIPSTRERLRARRCLFGKPEPKEVDKWLDECQTQMARQADEASTTWGFDFRRERPLDQPGPAPRIIEYEAIPVEKVPSFYSRTRANHKNGVRRVGMERETTPEGLPPLPLRDTPMRRRGIWMKETTPEGIPPSVPMEISKKRGMERKAKENEEETGDRTNDLPSTSNGRPMREKRKEKETKEINLRQARITNYLAPRKRPSQEKESKGTEKHRRVDMISSSTSSPSPAPHSPFRFADDSNISMKTMKKDGTRRMTRAVSARNL